MLKKTRPKIDYESSNHERARQLVPYIPEPRPYPNAIAPVSLGLWLPHHHGVFVDIVPGSWPRNRVNSHWTIRARIGVATVMNPERRQEILGEARADGLKALFAWLMVRLDLDETSALSRIRTITFEELASLLPKTGSGRRKPSMRKRKHFALEAL